MGVSWRDRSLEPILWCDLHEDRRGVLSINDAVRRERYCDVSATVGFQAQESKSVSTSDDFDSSRH